MGIKLLEARMGNRKTDGLPSLWTPNELREMFRAALAPDDPPADGPKPEAGPRLMRANAHFHVPEKHSMDQHVEDRDCEVLKCQPVAAAPDRPAPPKPDMDAVISAILRDGRIMGIVDEHIEGWMDEHVYSDLHKIKPAISVTTYGPSATVAKPDMVVPKPEAGPRACEHEWDQTELFLTNPPTIGCKKCMATKVVGKSDSSNAFIRADRPAPPSAEKWEPKVGEWWWHKLWNRPVKIISMDPVCMISISRYRGGEPFKSGQEYIPRKCTPDELYRPGAKVRCKMDDLEIIGIVERVDEKMNIKFRYLTDKKHCSYCELIESPKEI